MATSGQGEIRPVGFSSERHAELPVEVLDYDELIARMGPGHFEQAQRAGFGLVLLVHDGQGVHTVDFETIQLAAGRIVFVRPGQVQQWEPSDGVRVSIVMARESLCPTQGWFPGESAYGDLGADSWATALDLVAALSREQDRFVPDEVSVELMGALFAALVAVFRRGAASRAPAALPEAYLSFRAAIEADLGRSRNVRDYVAGLGFSERTVNRACRLVTGLSAKAILDERLLLEAKRLLAHSDRTVASVATTLGFSEATNFNKFFFRGVGELPSEFRNALRLTGYRADEPI